MARSKEFIPEKTLEKARDLFWKKGYHATSMQDLVDVMMINRGSIYDTYGDKHTLFIQCLKSYTDETLQVYKKVASGAKSPLQAIQKIIHCAIDRLCQQSRACMVVKASFEMAASDKDVCEVIKAEDRALLMMLNDFLKKAKTIGEIDSAADTDMLATYIVSSFAGWWQTHIIYKNKKSVLKMADFLIASIKN